MLIKMFDTLLWFARKKKMSELVTDRKATESIQLVADVVLVVATDTAVAIDRGTSFIITLYAHAWVVVGRGDNIAVMFWRKIKFAFINVIRDVVDAVQTFAKKMCINNGSEGRKM